MEFFIGILALIWSILCLVLFFKIWGMTNDVREILDCLKNNTSKNVSDEGSNVVQPSTEDEELQSKDLDGIPSNSLVVEISTGKQMRVKSMSPDGKYSCYINQGTTHYGDLSRNEFVLFDEYVKSKK